MIYEERAKEQENYKKKERETNRETEIVVRKGERKRGRQEEDGQREGKGIYIDIEREKG